MFWGLIMEPQRRYSQKVKKSFHVSMAALDITTATDSEPTQVICSFDNRNYLLCTLQKDKIIQVPLDLNFEVDDTVCFATNGKANIHLTGYLTDDFDALDETEDGDEELNESVELPPRKRQTVENNSSPPKKKSKTLELLAAVDSQKESDSSDSSFSLPESHGFGDDQASTDDDDEDAEEEGEEEEDDDDDKDDAEEEESEDDEDEESENDDDEDDEEASSLSDNEEEAAKPKGPKMNGVPKKNKQKQKEVKPQSPVSQKEKKLNTSKTEKQKPQPQKVEKLQKNESKTKMAKPSKEDSKTPAKTPQSPAQKRTLEGGVTIEELKLGNGAVAKAGRVVQVYYEGKLRNNNKMFDSTTKGPGFKFRLGRQEVIKGWDVGVVGMKIGGKRRITCPPNMAYGEKGSPPAIPPNSTLVFDVELKNIN